MLGQIEPGWVDVVRQQQGGRKSSSHMLNRSSWIRLILVSDIHIPFTKSETLRSSLIRYPSFSNIILFLCYENYL